MVLRNIPEIEPHEPWQSPNVDTWRRLIREEIIKLLNWSARGSDFDLTPDTVDQWVGNSEQFPQGVAVGVPQGAGVEPTGIKGVLINREGSQDPGGVALVGYEDQPAGGGANITDPGMLANAPVEIAGVPVLIMGGPAFLEVSTPLTEAYHLLLGPSSTLTDGRHISPLVLGPQYVPGLYEEATSAADVDLDDSGTNETIVTLTLTTGPYNPTLSTFVYEVRLSEEGGRDALFNVEIWVDTGAGFNFVFEDDYRFAGTGGNVTGGGVVTGFTLDVGDQIQMRVNSIGTHPQSDGWVRGSVRPSLVAMRQG